MIWLIFLSFLPVPAEAWSERKGESKKSKVKDALLLALYALALSLLGWKFVSVNPLKTVGLIIGFRILMFDYFVHFLLKRYSESHKNINVFTYSGTTAVFDRLVSRVNPVVRLVVRLLVFAIAVLAFLLKP